MRDRRFVATHRGGSLERGPHRLLAAWAAKCAGHVLPLFAACSDDERPERAVEAARAWARGELSVGAAMKAAVQAHAAARDATDAAAVAAARAAGHAAATAHMADHSLGAWAYALKAVHAAGLPVADERAWQDAELPSEVRELVESARSEQRFASVARLG
jgi:hypothetical protein